MNTTAEPDVDTVVEASVCYHCGDPCDDVPIEYAGHKFCCNGCRSVFEILNENDLCDFYRIRPERVNTQKGSSGSVYAYLDDEKVQSELLDFQAEDASVVRFYIPSIHCSACIWLLENMHKLKEGIQNVQVNFGKKEVLIQFNPSLISLKEVAELMDSIGYAPLINLSSNKEKKHTNKKLYYQLGVAGFCFGNIMLFSFPEYLGADIFSANYLRVFPYLNLLLALPVLLYSSQPYLISAWKGLQKRLLNIDVPISIGIIALFGRSAYEILSETGAGYMDSLSGLIFFLLIGRWYQERTYRNISFNRDYKSYFPLGVTRLDEGAECGISINDVEKNDRLLIRNQELIPADSILVEGDAMIDYSFVTGESDPKHKRIGSLLYAGGRQQGSAIEVIVQKKPDESYLTSLWNRKAFAKEQDHGVSKVANRISRYFTMVILAVALITGISWYFIDATRIWEIVTAVLIVACPCALALSVPFTYGSAMRLLARNGVYLRNTLVLEKFHDLTDVVFDKTGTLTTSAGQQITNSLERVSEDDLMRIKGCCAQSAHPLSKAVVAAISGKSIRPDRFEEIPGAGIKAFFGDREFLIGSAELTGLDSTIILETQVGVRIDNEHKGVFRFNRPLRAGVRDLFRNITSKYHIHVFSGDNERDKERLESLSDTPLSLQFNMGPDQKMDRIAELQDDDRKLAMVGDGLNDAGAIRQSDLGISVAEDIHQFTPSSDVIIRGDQVPHLIKVIDYASSVRSIVYWSFIISIIYNTIGLFVAINGWLTPIFAAIIMPISSVTIVLFVISLSKFRWNRHYKRGAES